MPETYAARLASELERAGLTQLDQQAQALGIPKRTLEDILGGRVETPQRKTRDKIDRWLGNHIQGEVTQEWPEDLKAFLNILGAYLINLPEDERLAAQNRTIARLAQRDY